MPRPQKDYNLDNVLAQIEDGRSQAEIARGLGITPGRLSQLLSADEDIAKRSARARTYSAEAWLDRGLEVIEAALDRSSGKDANAARAYAQECARRAAIRNPQYRDKQDVDLNAKVGMTVVISSADADL
jgi:transcriptional regulator with XRE-family HTH domain